MSSKFCSNCGAPIEIDTKFCANCGAVQKPSPPLNPPVPSPPTYAYANVPVGYPTPQPNVSGIKILAVIETVIGVLIALGSIAGIIGIRYLANRYAANGYQYTTETGYTINLQPIITIVYVLLGFVILFAICAIIFGIGLYKFRNWGRIGSMVISVIALFDFPLGTLYGGVMLYLLTRPENKSLFNQKNKFSIN